MHQVLRDGGIITEYYLLNRLKTASASIQSQAESGKWSKLKSFFLVLKVHKTVKLQLKLYYKSALNRISFFIF